MCMYMSMSMYIHMYRNMYCNTVTDTTTIFRSFRTHKTHESHQYQILFTPIFCSCRLKLLLVGSRDVST